MPAPILSLTHVAIAIVMAVSALFGSYAGGDWTWWLRKAHVRKAR